MKEKQLKSGIFIVETETKKDVKRPRNGLICPACKAVNGHFEITCMGNLNMGGYSRYDDNVNWATCCACRWHGKHWEAEEEWLASQKDPENFKKLPISS